MSITTDKSQIEDLARLSRLDLNSDELERFQRQIGEVLNTFRQLEKLGNSTSDFPDTSGLKNVSREDVIMPSLSLKQVLANAPLTQGDYFKVRGVFQ